jgi:signal transduction histidine kinase
MSLLLTRWITTPMGLLTKSLDAEAPNILVSLKSQRSEMGRLGQLITQFFDQKKKLLEEISQRKQAEEEVMAYAKRLEQSNQALDEFARVVAHDLKVPLSVISSLSELLMEHCRQKQDSASLNDLQQMQLATKQMNNLIGDLLEVSRLSRVPNQLRMVNIEELLSDILARFDHVIREKDAEVIIRDPMPAIQCDRVRLGEVFANLISNAIKYNDKPRCHIEIGCKKKREGYQFSVSDNGKGIDQKDFGHIFEIFQRLENVGTEEGTGVGLAIVKKVVELHNGKIWIESALGVGAIFYFIIPTDEMVLTGKKALSDING